MKTFAKYSTALQFCDLYFQIKLIFITDTSYWVPLGILGASFGWQWIVAICIEQTLMLWPWMPTALRQTSRFHPQATLERRLLCIYTLCAWLFFSNKLSWEFILAWWWNLFIWHKHAQGLFLGNFENSPFLLMVNPLMLKNLGSVFPLYCTEMHLPTTLENIMGGRFFVPPMTTFYASVHAAQKSKF